MGGSTPSAGPRPQVQYAEPLDYNALMGSAAAAARSMVREQYKAQIENYPALETQALGTVDRIAGRLGTTPQPIYEMVEKRNKKGKVTGFERKQVGMSEGNQQTADAMSAIRRSMDLYKTEDADPTSIERSLYDSAERDLALGRSLSAEDERAAQQSARTAFAARGMGTSLGSSAAEILSRQTFADQREAERRNFASAANNMMTQNVGQRRTAIANANIAGAQNLLNVDPYRSALGPGLGYAGPTQGAQMQQIGNTFGNAMTMAGNVGSFNANMLDSRANSALNNWAAMRGASMQAGATNNAAMMGLLGSSIQGGIQAGGMVGAAQFAPAMFSDKRMKKDIKPLGKAGSVLGLTAYEFSYKGEDQKHKGFMAQDVQKVLPEAVTEVDYKGKKRLAIRPDVIGAALAEELMTAKAA